MNPFRKNLFLVAATSLSLIVQPMQGVVFATPVNPEQCSPLPTSGTYVGIAKPRANSIVELNVAFSERTGYCLNDYFTSSNSQSLSYAVWLCDQGWNEILEIPPTTPLKADWIDFSPGYLALVPHSVSDMDIYYLLVIATNSMGTASQKLKVNIFDSTAQETDYAAYWVSIGSFIISGITIAITAYGQRQGVIAFARGNPPQHLGLLQALVWGYWQGG